MWHCGLTEILKEYPVTFSVVCDADKKAGFQVNVAALPASYILDRDGKVLSIERGTHIAQNRKELVKQLERLVQQNRKEKR